MVFSFRKAKTIKQSAAKNFVPHGTMQPLSVFQPIAPGPALHGIASRLHWIFDALSVVLHWKLHHIHLSSITASKFFKHRCISIRLQPVVTIHKGHPFSGRYIQTGVTGRRQSAVLLMNHFDSGVTFSPLVTQSGTRVRASVIHKDNLRAVKCLARNALHATVKRVFNLIHGYYDRKRSHSSMNFSLSKRSTLRLAASPIRRRRATSSIRLSNLFTKTSSSS